MGVDCYEMRIIATIAKEYCENVVHFNGAQTNSPTPESDARALNMAWIAAIQPAWLDCLPTDYALNGLSTKRVNNTGGPSNVFLRGGANGTRPGTVAATHSCPLLIGDYYESAGPRPSWRTGRIFMAGVAEADISQNVLAPALVGVLNTLGGLLQTPMGSGPEGPFISAIWSRTHLVSHVPLDWEVSLLVGTQRRRLHPVV
jgi:hypothetical protein